MVFVGGSEVLHADCRLVKDVAKEKHGGGDGDAIVGRFGALEDILGDH